MKYLVRPLVANSLTAPGSATNAWRTYAIVAPQSGMVAGIQAGSRYLKQQAWAAGGHQTFRFIPVDGEWCVIQVVGSNKFLDVQAASTSDGARIIEWDGHGGHNQQFRVERSASGRTFIITARHSGKVLDLQDFRQGAGGVIYQYDRHERENQQWILSEVKFEADLVDLTATIYELPDFQGASQPLGIGGFDLKMLKIGNDRVSSIRIPAGLRVTLHEHEHFSGAEWRFSADVAKLPANADDKASSIVVERVATLFRGAGYAGASYQVGVGRYRVQQLIDSGVGNDRMRSLRVPQGLMVTLFEHDDFKGDYVTVTEDTSELPDAWKSRVSSVIVKQTGVYVPDDALRYGGAIKLYNASPGHILRASGGGLGTTNDVSTVSARFTLLRSGATALRSHVCYGDVVSLKSHEGKYVVAEKDGAANANRDAIGSWERWQVMRTGASETRSFVCMDDVISLRSIAHDRLLVLGKDRNVDANATKLSDAARWQVASYSPPNAVPSQLRISTCGAEACVANVCPAEACGADACPAAACGAAGALVSACVAAASGIAACGIDVGGVAVGGIAACAAAAVGVGACGADACGAAACGAAACGAAACGAAACGADACGAAASLVAACGANAGGIDLCGADACGANACGINLCGADACGADVCGVDLIPVIPFI